MKRATGLIGMERALALDEKTGKILWTREWDADYTGTMQSYAIGPRATPTVDGDRVYVQTTMGTLICLNASTGAILWQKDYKSEFGLKIPVWGMTAAPLVDGSRVFAVTGGPDGSLVGIIELADHPWFVAVQFHPEFKSKPIAPHPLFAGFVGAAVERHAENRGQRV